MAAPSRLSTAKPVPVRAAARTVIASRENRWLKTFRAALKSPRPEGGRIALEGVHLVTEALGSGLKIEALLVSESGERHVAPLQPQLDSATTVLRTTDKLFDSVAATETPQGIAALAHTPEFTLDDLLRGANSLVVMLVATQDPGNVGAILRSAEAFGATGVIATRGAAHPYAPKALRASSGSSLRLPVLADMAAPTAMAQLRVSGLRLLAASSSRNSAAKRPDESNLREPFALLVGNEGAGLPPQVERSADALVRIQLAEPVESLNAAVAASLVLYEAARQRRANA